MGENVEFRPPYFKVLGENAEFSAPPFFSVPVHKTAMLSLPT